MELWAMVYGPGIESMRIRLPRSAKESLRSGDVLLRLDTRFSGDDETCVNETNYFLVGAAFFRPQLMILVRLSCPVDGNLRIIHDDDSWLFVTSRQLCAELLDNSHGPCTSISICLVEHVATSMNILKMGLHTESCPTCLTYII